MRPQVDERYPELIGEDTGKVEARDGAKFHKRLAEPSARFALTSERALKILLRYEAAFEKCLTNTREVPGSARQPRPRRRRSPTFFVVLSRD
jgi:hypothetical protein